MFKTFSNRGNSSSLLSHNSKNIYQPPEWGFRVSWGQSHPSRTSGTEFPEGEARARVAASFRWCAWPRSSSNRAPSRWRRGLPLTYRGCCKCSDKTKQGKMANKRHCAKITNYIQNKTERIWNRSITEQDPTQWIRIWMDRKRCAGSWQTGNTLEMAC